jgi:hypothetical protein
VADEPARGRPRGWSATTPRRGAPTDDGDPATRSSGTCKNARKQKVQVYDDKHRQMHTLSKESPDSRLKIDGAMAGGLSGRRAATASPPASPARLTRAPRSCRPTTPREASVPDNTPAAWLELLNKRLDALAAADDRHGRLRRLLRGRPPLAFATAKFREAFGACSRRSPTTGASSSSRPRPSGSRSRASGSASTPAPTTRLGHLAGQRPRRRVEDMVHTEAIKLGEAYWLVEPAVGDDDPPTHHRRAPVAGASSRAPADRRQRLAALKKWVDEDGLPVRERLPARRRREVPLAEKARAGPASTGSAAPTIPAAQHDLGDGAGRSRSATRRR